MAFNKITYHGNTLIDLTADTVTPETLAKGITAHAASGEQIVGAGNMGPAAYHVSSVDELPVDAAEGSMATVTGYVEGWVRKTWDNFAPTDGSQIWTDGTNTYYSSGPDHYVLEGDTWNVKSWTGLMVFQGGNVWTDGTNVYYSAWGSHYSLNKETSTWESKTWNGYSYFSGADVWTDGTNAYISIGSEHYVLDAPTDTWNEKSWPNIAEGFQARNIWTDGTDIYCTTSDNISGSVTLETAMVRTYILTDGAWVNHTIGGGYIGYADNIWSDGVNTYYTEHITPNGNVTSLSYILNGDTWEPKTWAGYTPYTGQCIWNHDGKTYISENGGTYMLGDVEQVSIVLRTDGEWINKGVI